MPSSFRRASIMDMRTSLDVYQPSSVAGLFECSPGTDRFTAEFGADLIHGAFRRRPLVALRVDQACGVGIVGRRQAGKAHTQKAETRAIGFPFQGCLGGTKN